MAAENIPQSPISGLSSRFLFLDNRFLHAVLLCCRFKRTVGGGCRPKFVELFDEGGILAEADDEEFLIVQLHSDGELGVRGALAHEVARKQKVNNARMAAKAKAEAEAKAAAEKKEA